MTERLEHEAVKDGQHRHGHSKATIVLEDDALVMVGKHLAMGKCPCLKPPIPQDANVPVHFVVDNKKSGEITVICGLCKAKLGKSRLKQVIDHNG